MQELIRQAQAGDAQAREELLAQLRPRLRGWVEHALSERFAGKIDVSDVTQETLLDVSQKIGQFFGTTQEEFLQWAREGVRRDVVDAIRRATAQRRSVDRERSMDDTHGVGQPIRDRLPSHLSTASHKAMRNEAAVALHEAIRQLPEDQASAIRMVHIEGLSVAQAAEQLDRSKEAVTKLLQRGMMTLGRRLRKGS